jgi:hypothetical protein
VIRGRTYAALFLVSFAALMAQVALTRFFSFSIWYHFAYMTISVAMLGYGAAGSAYYAFPGITRDGAERALARATLLGALAMLICLLIVAHVPFDPSRLFPQGTFDLKAAPIQYLYLVVFCLAVTAPFFAAGLCVTIILSNASGNIPQLYFADLLGAAAGCVAAVTLLTPLGAPGVIVLAAAMLAAAAILFAWEERRTRGLAFAMLALFAILGPAISRLGEVRASENKFLSRLVTDPNVEVLMRRWSPVYRVDVLGGKKGSPIRFGRNAAWGVSDRYVGAGPENLVITHDGDASTMMYKLDGKGIDGLDILDHTMLRLPYVLLDKPEVLVIGAGGGIDLLTGLRNHARHVTGIELNPVTVGVLKRDFVEYNGNVFNRPDITLQVDEGRNYVRRGDKKYDLIEITGIDTLAAIYSGAYLLSESYLYTVEAMEEYLAHLTPTGVLSLVRGDWLFKDQPPRQVLRLLSVAIQALQHYGVTDPERHIVLTKSGASQKSPIFNLIVRRAPFTPEEVARIKAHIEQEGFEPWHLPGEKLETPGGTFMTMNAAERQRFIDGNWMNLSATTDDQPFFFNFVKWRALLSSATRRADYTFASGQLVLVAILVQSIILALLLIVAPLLRTNIRPRAEHRVRYLLYFACLGLGFIFIEISYIQRFALFLGSPVFSLSVSLASLLLASGVGSLLSSRLAFLRDTPSALRRLIVALCVLNIVYMIALPSIFDVFLGTGFAVRVAVTVLLLAPAGMLMGAFLPVGMRVLTARAPDVIPWAWAANGVTSVVGSILCIVLAMGIGFRAVNAVALAVYILGVLALLPTAGGLDEPAR